MFSPGCKKDGSFNRFIAQIRNIYHILLSAQRKFARLGAKEKVEETTRIPRTP
jgi:hypothetical protein